MGMKREVNLKVDGGLSSAGLGTSCKYFSFVGSGFFWLRSFVWDWAGLNWGVGLVVEVCSNPVWFLNALLSPCLT